MDGFLQAWNYSSHLPLIPSSTFVAVQAERRYFFVLPALLSIKIIIALLDFLFFLVYVHLSISILSRSLFNFLLTVYGTVVNGRLVYRLSFCQSAAGDEGLFCG